MSGSEIKKAPMTVLYHGTSSVRWRSIQADGLLKTAPYGDRHVSLTDDLEVARYWTRMACLSEEGGTPVVLKVDVDGLPTQAFSSQVWGEGACDWESETACMVDIPVERIIVHEERPDMTMPARAIRHADGLQRIQGDAEILAHARRDADGGWRLEDAAGGPIGSESYETPSDAADAFDVLKGRNT